MSAPRFDRGDIVHTLSPHPDGGDSKHWALIVGDPSCNSYGDYVLVQITSRPFHGPSDFRLSDADPEFQQTGLQHSSTFRCHKVFPLAESRVRTKIGEAGPNTMRKIEACLRRVFLL